MKTCDFTSVQHKQRREYLRIALGLSDITISRDDVLDTLIHTIDEVNLLKGDFTIRDAASIKAQVRTHYTKEANRKKRKKKAT